MRAPVDGTVNNLSVSVGDTASAGKALVGIVDAAGWRIVANYKENYIRNLRPGNAAWVQLDTHPWRLYRARIEGVSRGISRGGPEQDGLLPYVAPHHRLDQVAAPLSGNAEAGRSSIRPDPLHGIGCQHADLPMRQALAELVGAVRGELAELSLSGPRLRQANIAALAVGLALVLALILRLNNPWWAGISAFMCVQASHPQSWQRAGWRIVGTLAGAIASFFFFFFFFSLLYPWQFMIRWQRCCFFLPPARLPSSVRC